MMSRIGTRRLALAAVLLAGTTLGGFAVVHAANDATAPVNPVTVATAGLPDFSDLVSRVKPAVVSITTKARAPAVEAPSMPFPFNQMVPEQPQRRMMEGRGSGFIVDAGGTIITNNHVVKDATSVTVTLDDGRALPARVIGRDPRTDIAVLRVDAGRPLPYIQMGNSRAVKPGEWVVAMGNPFGLGGTVTAGIVSAVGRDIGAGPYDQFIQIDAPINQGNSGGPLFTQDGKVIGMNTAILSPHGGSVGIGFAVPSDLIRTVSAQIEANGRVTRGFLGVESQPVMGTTARALGVAENAGALLAAVGQNSPAAKAGLRAGDIVRAVNGSAVAGPRDLAIAVADLKPGDAARVEILRDGAQREVTVTVGEMPSERLAAAPMAQPSERPRLGVALAPLSPEMRGQLEVPDDVKGVVVQGVRPGSPAEAAGLRPGDVILGVGNTTVATPAEAGTAIREALSAERQAIALRVLRDGATRFVGIGLDRSANNAG